MLVIGIFAFIPAVDINTGDVKDLLVSVTESSFHVGIIFIFLVVLCILSGLFLLMAVGHCAYGCCCKPKVDYKRVSIFEEVKTNSTKKKTKKRFKITESTEIRGIDAWVNHCPHFLQISLKIS